MSWMNAQERVESAVSAVARMVISLILPLWGLGMIILGLSWMSPWWIACGAVTGAVGLILAVGNPLIWPLVSDTKSRRPGF